MCIFMDNLFVYVKKWMFMRECQAIWSVHHKLDEHDENRNDSRKSIGFYNIDIPFSLYLFSQSKLDKNCVNNFTKIFIIQLRFRQKFLQQKQTKMHCISSLVLQLIQFFWFTIFFFSFLIRKVLEIFFLKKPKIRILRTQFQWFFFYIILNLFMVD